MLVSQLSQSLVIYASSDAVVSQIASLVPPILQFVTFGGLVFIMHVRIARCLTDGFERTFSFYPARGGRLATRRVRRLRTRSRNSRLRPASLTLVEVLIENRLLRKMRVEGRTK